MSILVVNIFQIIHIPENGSQSVNPQIIVSNHFLIFVLIIHMGSQISLLTICQVGNPLCILVAGNADIPQNKGKCQKDHCPWQGSVEQNGKYRIRFQTKLQCSCPPLLHIPVSGMITAKQKIQITDSMIKPCQHTQCHSHIIHGISNPQCHPFPVLHR